ncbi:MAG TPA: hypothetical protein VK590_04705 [Saprospiraceae bacterium]|nr:hypothetical protein [Saprospiraceae bacterium]
MEENSNFNISGCRAMIAAILDQAFSDALSRKNNKEKRTAIAFIDDKNDLFVFYCNLLDLEAEYVAKKMQEQIKKLCFKPLMKFRE